MITTGSIINHVRKTIQDNNLLNNKDRILVACSGGADSIALLEILRSLMLLHGWYIHVCHVNHHIRGKEADEDALWVANFCRMRGIDCSIESVDALKFADEQKLSEEEAARILRYEALQKVADKENLSVIATGHNREDNAETLLMNILRGSALQGLTGIKMRRDNVIRPLLDVPRKVIEDFCNEQGISYRTDSTNKDKKYLRNKVRLELIPTLKEYNPEIITSLTRLSNNLFYDAEYLDKISEIEYKNIVEENNNILYLPLKKLKELDYAILTRVFLLAIKTKLYEKDNKYIASKHIFSIGNLFYNLRTGAMIEIVNGLKVKKDYNNLLFSFDDFIEKEQVIILEQKLPVPGYVVLPNNKIIRASIFRGSKPKSKNKNHAVFPFCFENKNLIIRSRQTGDTFKPLGMNGKSQKIKDFFIDNKVSVDERESIPLVCDDEGVLWIAGFREAHRAFPESRSWLFLEYTDKG